MPCLRTKCLAHRRQKRQFSTGSLGLGHGALPCLYQVQLRRKDAAAPEINRSNLICLRPQPDMVFLLYSYDRYIYLASVLFSKIPFAQ